jgi:hypothetical protein
MDTVSAGSYDSADKLLVLEASKPLCSGDSRDICLGDNSTIGFALDYFTSAGTATLHYPVAPDDFAGFAHLEMSAKPLSADLAVSVRADKATVNAGEPVKFTVDVTNNGPDTADNGIVDIPVAALSPGITATATPSKACGCAFESLAPGQHMTFPPRTIVPTSVPSGGGTITLSADASASEPDPRQADNTDTLSVRVTSAPSVGQAFTTTPTGPVTVSTPGSSKPTAVTSGQSIANGSEVDATRGSISIVSKTPARKLQTVKASKGKFVITQPKTAALTVLKLSAHVTCGVPHKGPWVMRQLRVDAKGTFQTRGNRGYAMPEGKQASWVTTDWCIPAGGRVPAAAGKKAKWYQASCYKNTSDNADVCAKLPKNAHEKMLRPGERLCG